MNKDLLVEMDDQDNQDHLVLLDPRELLQMVKSVVVDQKDLEM